MYKKVECGDVYKSIKTVCLFQIMLTKKSNNRELITRVLYIFAASNYQILFDKPHIFWRYDINKIKIIKYLKI